MRESGDRATSAEPLQTCEPDERPVFILAPHRSGSSLLQRILNCHPDLVVWGEEAGVLNKLAELDEITRIHESMYPSPARIHEFPFGGDDAIMNFDPWLNPFTRDEFRTWSRSFIKSIHSKGLRENQRWGIKEIRYSSPGTVSFLSNIFPGSQFVVLRRDLVDLCVSNILAAWSMRALLAMGVDHDKDAADEVLSDCAYALCVIDRQLEQASAALGGRALPVWHYQLSGTVDPIFDFLGLGLTTDVRQKIDRAKAAKVGVTSMIAKVGLLDREYVKERAPALIQDAQAAIARSGPDWERLRHNGSRGKYTFVVGDHHLRSTPLSSIF